MKEVDELDPATLTLCASCAKHESLKQFVRANAGAGVRCGVCLRKSNGADTCDLQHRQALIYLIRSLIRFFYDEADYNSHWGADETTESLLQQENPILEHGSGQDSLLFLENIFANEPYPDYGKGVSVYAGFDEGLRLINQSIRRGGSDLLSEFQERLLKENYFAVEPGVAKVIEAVAERIAAVSPPGSIYYRARIGHAGRYLHYDGLDTEVRYKPYQDALLGAPPPQTARAGRLNRAGVSFLYLASDADTACAEVRPHPGHIVSIGQYRNVRSLCLADLNADIAAFSTSDTQLDLFKFVYAADQAMSFPVVPEEIARYSITQLLADVLRQHGFDGVSFRSSVSAGHNVCIFSAADFEFVEGSASVRRVESLAYTVEDVPSVQSEGPDDVPLR